MCSARRAVSSIDFLRLDILWEEMIMRGIKKVFAVGLIVVLTWDGFASADVDVESIRFGTWKHHIGGIAEPSPFRLDVVVHGSNINSVQVTSPTGITAFGWSLEDFWLVDLGEQYATLTDLREDFPVGPYEFVFNLGEASEDSVTVDTDPGEELPSGFANITYPAHGATDVPVEPTFTWEPCTGYGDSLLVQVHEHQPPWVYSALLDIGETSWTPGGLVPGGPYSLVVGIIKVSVDGQPLTTENGDSLIYRDFFCWENKVSFTVVGEPQVMIEETLAFFDASVEAGTLVGQGSGNSAECRLNALKNMLERAANLIDDGFYEEACEQLRDAYAKCDGLPTPPDFVVGPACEDLAAMIQDVTDSLGCQ
jgi:hypothetical protein